MKKILLFVVAFFVIWIGFTRWVNLHSSYPWELFKFSVDPQKTLAWKSADDCWKDFRMNFPYHIQTIGITDDNDDGSNTVIISEPPPNLDTTLIRSVLGHLKVEILVKLNPIGYDGWVKDIVVVLSGGSSRQKRQSMNDLYKYVFDSNYKPYFLNLSSNPAQFNKNARDMNYSVSAAEIKDWFLTNSTAETFYSPQDSNASYKVPDLINQDTYGVFYSKTPGFVLWVIPKASISAYQQAAHQFVMDTDLILGSIANSNKLVIIGRERKESVFVLPPLRVETIYQLAAANKKQISQSYERMNMFAGKLPGGKDWAPIFLSKDLINTEYGSLLNITDQMLKSWSQHGEVSYQNFLYQKPGPDDYPYSRALSAELETRSLTFNWNTKGAAYIVKYDSLEVAALNRTGSLPVTYIPEGISHDAIPYEKIRHCEENFYNFFSSRCDPNLIRVVQYASIYQIFSAYNITADPDNSVASADISVATTDTTAQPDSDVATSYAKILLEKIQQKDIKLSERSKSDTGLLSQLDQYYDQQDLESVLKVVDKVRPTILAIYKAFGQPGIDQLAQFIGHPRVGSFDELDTALISKNALYRIYGWFNNNRTNFSEINERLEYFGLSRSEIKEKYVKSYSSSFSHWIKTPSIVVSWASDSTRMIGGHDIRAAMPKLEVDLALQRGEIKITEENGLRKINVSPGDIDHITPAIIKDIESNNTLGAKQITEDMLDGAVRKRDEVFPSGAYRERGLSYAEVNSTQKIEKEVSIHFNGRTFNQVNIGGEDYVSIPSSPYILYPKGKIEAIDGINAAMKNRQIAPSEFKVVSFVDDATTNATLNNYCPNSFYANPSINSVADLDRVFSKNPHKTFHLLGHIEDGAIYNPYNDGKLLIADIQKAAEKNQVNYMIVGCKSAFQKGHSPTGFVNNINSVEVAQALGMAIEDSRDMWTFTHTLARNSDLKLVVYEMPLKDFGSTTLRNGDFAFVGGTGFGLPVGTVLVIGLAATLSDNPNKTESQKDTSKSKKIS